MSAGRREIFQTRVGLGGCLIAIYGLLLGALLCGCGGGTTLTICDTCGRHQVPPPNIVTTITLSVAGAEVVTGQSAMFKATVSPSAASGTVTITDLTNTQGISNPPPTATAALQQGSANLVVVPPNAGLRVYEAVYSGDATYESSAVTITVTSRAPASLLSCGLGTGVYVLSGGVAAPTQTNFTSTQADESAVCAQGLGTTLTLNSPTIVKSGFGVYGSSDPSGVDAGVLAYGSSATVASGATINLQGAPVISASSAQYGAFASGNGATINLLNADVTAMNSIAALGAGNNGVLNLDTCTVNADRDPLVIFDGGTVNIQNSSLTSTLYSGQILIGSSDSVTNIATHFRMVGGSLGSALPNKFPALPNFEVSGVNPVDVYFSHVDFSKLTTSSGRYFVSAGGTVVLTLDHQAVSGTIAGGPGTTLTLQNGSRLDGDFLGGGNLSLDASSSLTIHSSYSLQVFNDPGGISASQVTNVTGNNQTLLYSNALNPQLGGLTYTLQGGGTLKPY